jgi:cystathionine beta-synthase
MKQHGYQQADWEIGTIAEMVRAMPPCNLVTVGITDQVQNVVSLFKERGFSQLPVMDGDELAGILTEADVLQSMFAGRVRDKTTVAEIMERKVSTVASNADSSELPRIFERGEVAIVVDEDGKVSRIITKLDLIEYLSSGNAPQA